MNDKERFLSKFIKNEINGCWEWDKGLFHSGYGKFWDKKNVHAHRFSYRLFKGEISNNLEVCHTCDNKKCVNPEHLWLGTHKENMQDMSKKGRSGGGKNVNHFRANVHRKKSLPNCQVDLIRNLYIKRIISQRKIAKLFKVSQSTVRNIVNYNFSYSEDLAKC